MIIALTPQVVPAVAAATTSSSGSSNTRTVLACQKDSAQTSAATSLQRRIITWGLAGAALGVNIGHEQTSLAAARRPPPPPPDEKKDPNVSGVQAKVLASKKRKEAMKEAMAKQRERGKPISDK
ncbi:hypothetical protein Ancab_008339 [Ancistrocladus abbreviatus]